MAKAYRNIYLSGWEYNRLLSSDPVEPRISALPAEILWNGAAPLWLFEHVYVTKESLDNDLRGYDRFGWVSPLIFQELADPDQWDVLKPVDWRGSDIPVGVTEEVRQVHSEILRETSAAAVRQFIEQKSLFELDQLKLRLLQPITDALGCVPYFSPNALKNWRAEPDPLADPVTLPGQIVRQVGEPINLGTSICRHPRDAAPEAFRRQNEVESTIGRKLIAAHVAGGGSFGRSETDEYLESLAKRREVFPEGNKAMEDDWIANRDKLRFLRDHAESTGLWKKLHEEWLPELLDDSKGPQFAERFPSLVRQALAPKIVDRLDLESKCAWLVGRIAVVAWIVAAMSAEILSTKSPTQMVVALFLGAPIADKLSELAKRDLETRRREIGPLAAFYQEARVIQRQTS